MNTLHILISALRNTHVCDKELRGAGKILNFSHGFCILGLVPLFGALAFALAAITNEAHVKAPETLWVVVSIIVALYVSVVTIGHLAERYLVKNGGDRWGKWCH